MNKIDQYIKFWDNFDLGLYSLIRQVRRSESHTCKSSVSNSDLHKKKNANGK